jgi:hypothetical protein
MISHLNDRNLQIIDNSHDRLAFKLPLVLVLSTPMVGCAPFSAFFFLIEILLAKNTIIYTFSFTS